MAERRIAEIDQRLNDIKISEQTTQNEQFLISLQQERVILTNERFSLTSQAPAAGTFENFIELLYAHCKFSVSAFHFSYDDILFIEIILWMSFYI